MDYAERIGQEIVWRVKQDGEYAEVYGWEHSEHWYEIGIYDHRIEIQADPHAVRVRLFQESREASGLPSRMQWAEDTSCWGLLAAEDDEAVQQTAIELVAGFIVRAIKEA